MAIDTQHEVLPDDSRTFDLRTIKDTFHTTKHLAHAAKQAAARKYSEYLIVDSDAHHYEFEAWPDIIKYVEDDVVRHRAEHALESGRPSLDMLHVAPARQNQSGRNYTDERAYYRAERAASEKPAEIAMIRREMDAIGLDYQIVFPTPMLSLGMHPDPQVEVALSWAYSRWMTEEILPHDDYIKSLVYLPANDPVAAERTVEYFTGKPGVVGFEITSARHRPMHDNCYMRLYRMLEERDLPLAFHAGLHDWEGLVAGMNKFISVHAIGFVIYNLIHMINLVVNGIPERFPKLKIIWIESGLAWVPFIMQRLDNEFMMRVCEAPLLRRPPSEY